MNNLRAAAQQALKAMTAPRDAQWQSKHTAAVKALEAALAQEQAEQTWVCPEAPEERTYSKPGHCENCGKTLVLAQEQAEPVAWYFEARHIDSAWAAAVSLKYPGPEGKYVRKVTRLYAAPQRRPLTEDEIRQVGASYTEETWIDEGWSIAFARAMERAHGIGGQDSGIPSS